MPIRPGSRRLAPRLAALSSVADAPHRLPPGPARSTIASIPATSRSRAKSKSRSHISSTVSPPRAAMSSAESWTMSAASAEPVTELIACRK
ncbi:hypothetical protein ADL33_05645 [Streptomyces sp. NRRL WC-3604]|nr:hypothetical protein ADL33_05645 [Streptomyces sp. NRRL WC-3604]